MFSEGKSFRLLGKTQHYAWGGYTFIPDMIGIKAEPDVTYAEYWMGAHEKAPSDIEVDSRTTKPLNLLIKDNGIKILGEKIASNFGRLPFLFKILDVRETLSIQVHPNKIQARAGFSRENDRNIPLDSPYRNYKDDNHKPELQVALDDFWLLHGFLSENKIEGVLNTMECFSILKSAFKSGGIYGLYKYIMEMPLSLVNVTLGKLSTQILPDFAAGKISKSSPNYWAAKTMFNSNSKEYDRGIFSVYFFNLVLLKPGQGIFQDAGLPHAALEGHAIEIMANSDNVIRGGLTPKYIDVPELLNLVRFEETFPKIISNSIDSHQEFYYTVPCTDFLLSTIQLDKGAAHNYHSFSAEIILLLSGEAVLTQAGTKITLRKGNSVILFADTEYQMEALSEPSVLYKASVGQ